MNKHVVGGETPSAPTGHDDTGSYSRSLEEESGLQLFNQEEVQFYIP